MIKGIILDFDEVIVNTIKSCCKTYCKDTLIVPDVGKLYQWNMLDIFPEYEIEDIGKLFEKDDFWNFLTIKKGAIEFIEKYSKDFKVIICSKGSLKNLEKKAKFIKENLGNVETILLTITNNSDTDKSIINMKDYIFVDDNENNLFSSNATHQVIFGSFGFQKEWNENFPGYRVENFTQLDNIISEIIDKEK